MEDQWRYIWLIKKLVITGIDLSSEMLKIAKVNVPDGIFHLQDSRKASFPQ